MDSEGTSQCLHLRGYKNVVDRIEVLRNTMRKHIPIYDLVRYANSDRYRARSAGGSSLVASKRSRFSLVRVVAVALTVAAKTHPAHVPGYATDVRAAAIADRRDPWRTPRTRAAARCSAREHSLNTPLRLHTVHLRSEIRMHLLYFCTRRERHQSRMFSARSTSPVARAYSCRTSPVAHSTIASIRLVRGAVLVAENWTVTMNV